IFYSVEEHVIRSRRKEYQNSHQFETLVERQKRHVYVFRIKYLHAKHIFNVVEYDHMSQHYDLRFARGAGSEQINSDVFFFYLFVEEVSEAVSDLFPAFGHHVFKLAFFTCHTDIRYIRMFFSYMIYYSVKLAVIEQHF